MKKTHRLLLFAVLLAGLSLTILTTLTAAPQTGEVPDSIQGAFYDPSYNCIYMEGQNVKPNTWQNYTMDITKKNIAYDGKSGNFTNFTMLRIKANTKKSGKKLAVYIDNVVLKDTSGKKVVDFTFEDGKNHGPYFSWGKKKSDAGKVVTVDGRKCFLMHGTTSTQYGSTGLEVQWVMKKGESYSFKKPGYTLSFDYYVATE